jgi:diguanylate cyclase (GGDEF)-like protein
MKATTMAGTSSTADAGRRSVPLPAALAAALGVVFLVAHLSQVWSQLDRSASARARWLAEAVRPVDANPKAWPAHVAAVLEFAGGDATLVDERRSVLDVDGQAVAESGAAAAIFGFTRAATVFGDAGALGQVRVSRSLAPLGWAALVDVIVVALCGIGVFFGWRHHVETSTGRKRRKSRPEPSEAFDVLFARSDDGLLICAPDGQIVACNSAAERLFASPAASIVGTPVGDWLAGGRARDDANPFPIVSGEWSARRRGADVALAVAVEVHAAQQHRQPCHIVSVRDLTGERQTQEKLEYLANYDSLTGLPNRALFRDRLAQAMERSRRSGQPMALLFLDLDRFKVVNDSLGHEVGDRLLCHVAGTLTNSLRNVDSVGRKVTGEPFTLSRLGGDEFTVIAESIGGAEDAALIARRLLEALAVPFSVNDEELHISASIGISMYPMDDVDLDGMVRHTDMAMYRSKSLGRNTFSFFSDDLNAAVGARLSLEGNLRRALERKEFCLYYQPKADLMTGRVTGVEALLRWHAPGRGMVPPDRFIAVLEDTGLIVQVGAWVLRAACKQLAEWDRLGLPQINMAVNLSARQLRHPYLISLVSDTLRETGIAPSRLELELTESLLMEDTEVNRGVLTGFARLGVRLAIDDFGTGHSSLSYLRRLDVDTLKIDRSFVTEIPNDPEDCAIATAVLALGQSLQMKVVAEGVETQEQAEFLRNLGCSEMQGWLLSRALPAANMATWLHDKHTEYVARTTPRHFGSNDLDPLPSIRIPQVVEHH